MEHKEWRTDVEQWLINLREIKGVKGYSSKYIAEKGNLSERSVSRIFAGETENPGVDIVRRIINVLGCSWADIFGETNAVIGGKDLATLQGQIEILTIQADMLNNDISEYQKENAKLISENCTLKNDIAEIRNEVNILQLKISHKDELLRLHSFYMEKLK